ncbi:hypothetical protein [Kitasatospora sp. GP82]|uniref:hypothetical protein n=1 Tax=Kitasatospora sp. GP82 TaxID=3035089 RepID=UPI0024746981|nr:hypothetical protein [Kitasatospora sp. GP82]MDH6125471.1 hypothetical protein [Kitasatospora sp. GP82]
MEEWRTEALTELVLDSEAREDERVDAAMDLCESDDPRARAALMQVCCEQGDEYSLTAACAGESLGEVAARTAPLTVEESTLFRPEALKEYRASYRRFAGVGKEAIQD